MYGFYPSLFPEEDGFTVRYRGVMIFCSIDDDRYLYIFTGQNTRLRDPEPDPSTENILDGSKYYWFVLYWYWLLKINNIHWVIVY